MTSVFSWQNSISLCPASFCTSKPSFPVTPGVSFLPTFAFQSTIMKRTKQGQSHIKNTFSRPKQITVTPKFLKIEKVK